MMRSSHGGTTATDGVGPNPCHDAGAVADVTPLLRPRPAWKALEAHHAAIAPRHLRDLFAGDPARGDRLHAEAVGLYLDYSKHRVIDETIELLVALADECGLRD